MASSPFHFRLYRFLQQRQQQRQRGFTLIELLVSILIASLIIASLLYLVVEMLRSDRSEAALNQVQQDTQRAMDYITQDMGEAVFVYPDQEAVDRIMDELSDEPDGTPILVFWRTDPIDAEDIEALGDCEDYGDEDEETCNVVKLRQNVYTLVAYFLQPNAEGEIWQGNSRIIRYELSQYDDISTLDEKTGYADPVESTTTFETWEADGATTAGVSAVLVDSIDNPDEDLGDIAIDCTEAGANYNPIPDPDVTASYSFFVCVRDPVLTTDEEEALEGEVALGEDDTTRNNQNVVVYLRGDAFENREGLFTTSNLSDRSRLPTLESRILVRGILDKRPQ